MVDDVVPEDTVSSDPALVLLPLRIDVGVDFEETIELNFLCRPLNLSLPVWPSLPARLLLTLNGSQFKLESLGAVT